jgi:hypothetical protein
MTVRGSLAGCTVTGPVPVTILSGKIRGRVTAASNECATVSEPLMGGLTIAWKADPATAILQRSSALEITGVTFEAFGAPWGGAAYGQFSLGVAGVTGAFTGGDEDVTSTNVSLTSQDFVAIGAQCRSPRGLKTIEIGLGTMTLR